MEKIYFLMAILNSGNSCEKAFSLRTTVSGQVVDYIMGEPIRDARIILQDGIDGSGPFTESDFTTDAMDVAYTDENGKFSVQIRANHSVFLIPSKHEEYWPYDLGETAITNKANGYKKGSSHKNELIELKAKAFVEGFFMDSKNQRDSLIVYVLESDLIAKSWNSYTSPIGKKFMPYGNFLIIGNDYYRYQLDFKRDGTWHELIDSVCLEKLETFRDTIYF